MPKTCGRSLALSPPRRLMTDLMDFSRHAPTIVAERRMSLAPLVAARRSWPTRPCWSAVFIKAFGTVAAKRPELRRSYLSFPRPHLYEHPVNVASVTIEREYAGEPAVFFGHVTSPEQRSLAALDGAMRRFKQTPVEKIGAFRRMLLVGRLPWPLRPLLWWLAFNWSGRQRARILGTFGLTTVASFGAGLVRVITPLSATLHFGVFDGRGDIDVRLSFDHRVLDGATAARALADLETVLLTETLTELRRPAGRAYTAAEDELHSTPSSTSVTN